MLWVLVGVIAAMAIGIGAWADWSRRRRGLVGGIDPRHARVLDSEAWSGGGMGGGDGGGGGGS